MFMTRFYVFLDQREISFAQTKVRKVFAPEPTSAVDFRPDQRQAR